MENSPEKIIPTSDKNHLGYLDAARGIAAIMVMVYHYIGWRYPDKLIIHLASMIFNGSDAVSFFFVLSGMVLSYKHVVLKKPMDVGHFYIVRYFRLWPAFFFTMLINTVYYCRHDIKADWHALIDIFLKNKTEFWEEALLIRGHPKFFIPSWTLAVELGFSFLMPFGIALANKNRKLIPWLIICFVLMGGYVNMFAVHFMLGLVLTCWFNEIKDISFRKTVWYRWRVLWLLIAFVLFSIRHIDRISPIGSTYKYVAGYLNIDLFHYTGIASFVFLVALIHYKSIQKIFEHKILRFFGTISYGIYLMHWLFVAYIFDHWDFCTRILHGNRPAFLVMLLVCAGCTFTSAWLVHIFIELPFIRFSKNLVQRLRPTVAVN